MDFVETYFNYSLNGEDVRWGGFGGGRALVAGARGATVWGVEEGRALARLGLSEEAPGLCHVGLLWGGRVATVREDGRVAVWGEVAGGRLELLRQFETGGGAAAVAVEGSDVYLLGERCLY